MVRKDLVAGLKNAVERGENLEQAKHSFISAGYSMEEVEEASRFVYSGSVLALTPKKEKLSQQKTTPMQTAGPAEGAETEEPETGKPEKESIISKVRKNLKIILLAGVLVILIIILIITFIFKEQILNLFT